MKNLLHLPGFRAAALLLLCLTYRLCAFPLGLHNDDIQITYMLSGGGEEASAYSAFNDITLGWGIKILSSLFPHITWYPLIMLTLAAGCCLVFNTLVENKLTIKKTHHSYSILTTTCCRGLLIYINLECLLFLQYTFIAILCGSTAAILFGRAALQQSGCKTATMLTALFLFSCTYLLRHDAIFAPLFLIAGFITSSILTHKTLRLTKSATLILTFAAISIAALYTIHQQALAQNTEWQQTAQSIKSRVNIQDYPDNSGIDKSLIYKRAGIDSSQLRVFKTFTYTPSLSNIDLIRKAEQIHCKDRKGLFGIEATGRIGLLEFDPKLLLAPFRSLMSMTQLIPLGLMGLLFLISLNRKSLRENLPILLSVSLYALVLILVKRYSDRVMEPAYLCSAVWLMLHLPDSCPRFDNANRFFRWGVFLLAFACILASLRHMRPGAPASHPLPWEFCKANPDKLYITTCMQGCGLYPTGITGFTQEYIKKSNIIPIADGCFFTPQPIRPCSKLAELTILTWNLTNHIHVSSHSNAIKQQRLWNS